MKYYVWISIRKFVILKERISALELYFIYNTFFVVIIYFSIAYCYNTFVTNKGDAIAEMPGKRRSLRRAETKGFKEYAESEETL